jgi:hypothetical protein
MAESEQAQPNPTEREFAQVTAGLSIAAIQGDAARFSDLSAHTRELLTAIAAERKADPAPALEAFKSIRCGVDEAEAGNQMAEFHQSLDFMFRED